jgi:hypothetical protein
MVKTGFLYLTNALTEEALKALPIDINPPTLDRRSRTVVFFHDESTFQSNEDQTLQWGTERKQNDEAKRKGSWNHGY